MDHHKSYKYKDPSNLYAVKRWASLVKSGIKWFEKCPYSATIQDKLVLLPFFLFLFSLNFTFIIISI